MTEAEPIVSNVPGSFAWGGLRRRHPALIEQVRAGLPWSPDRQRALTAFAEAAGDGVMEPLARTAHDRALWTSWGRGNFGRRWRDAPFLWAESYFYRRLLDATGYFADGPWRGVDPFGPAKTAELATPEVAAELRALDEFASRPLNQRADALLGAALWGNRADLGFRISVGAEPVAGAVDGTAAADELEVVADDSGLFWSLLSVHDPGDVGYIADNSGRELLADLILIDHLLEARLARRVILHVKPYPYYVSDATNADVVAVLGRIIEAGGAAGKTGARLWTAMADGRVEVRTHPFWCAPLSFHHLPADLSDQLAAATVTVLKGDLNYRRLVGDRTWPATYSFAELTDYFPSPLAALRTLKSDVVVGLGADDVARLDATGEAWRTAGTRALVQVRP